MLRGRNVEFNPSGAMPMGGWCSVCGKKINPGDLCAVFGATEVGENLLGKFDHATCIDQEEEKRKTWLKEMGIDNDFCL